MGFFDTLLDVVTLGEHGRASEKLAEYQSLQQQLESSYDALERKRGAANQRLHELIAAKTAGVAALRALSRISKNLSARERSLSNVGFDRPMIEIPLARIESTVSTADVALNSAKGAGAGISTALGTWALVGTLGTASTGTAIGTLTGAAATNATLAWLGGGSLASGGLGMAGGAAVLGGIVVIPALVVMGLFTRAAAKKKIREIEEAKVKALAALESCKQLALKLDIVDRRATELIDSLRKAAEVVESRSRTAIGALFPRGILSRMFRSLRRFFGGRYFTDADLQEISPLLQIAAELAALIDVRILDESGNLL